MLKTMDALKYPSNIFIKKGMLAVFAVFYLIIVVIVNKFTELPIGEPSKTFEFVSITPTTLLAFPLIIYAHNCHVLLFPIVKELNNPTKT